jgi:hypothetical protein
MCYVGIDTSMDVCTSMSVYIDGHVCVCSQVCVLCWQSQAFSLSLSSSLQYHVLCVARLPSHVRRGGHLHSLSTVTGIKRNQLRSPPCTACCVLLLVVQETSLGFKDIDIAHVCGLPIQVMHI